MKQIAIRIFILFWMVLGLDRIVTQRVEGMMGQSKHHVVRIGKAAHYTPYTGVPRLHLIKPRIGMMQSRTALTACQMRSVSCARAVVEAINADRAGVGSAPLRLDWSLANTTPSCIAATGHSRHMAEIGQLAHDQFPQDLCGSFSTGGENIGMAGGMSKYEMMQATYQQMMAEPGWMPGCTSSHICNFRYAGYSRVGVGFAQAANGDRYITYDFEG